MRRHIACFIALLLLFNMASPCLAATKESVSPRFNYTQSVTAYLDIDTSLGIAYCQGSCLPNDVVPVTVRVSLEYYSESTGEWQSIKIWQTSGTGYAGLEGYYAIYKGFNYRVHTIGYVYNESGILREVVSATDYVYY